MTGTNGSPYQRSALSQTWWFLRRWPVLPLVILSVLVIVGAGAPWIAPNDPLDQELPLRSAKPFYKDGSPYLLGGDHVGRDVFSRGIYGARISLTVMVSCCKTRG